MSPDLSRRAFVTAAATGAVALAAGRARGANDRIRMAVIGCGGMGSGHLGGLVKRAEADNVAGASPSATSTTAGSTRAKKISGAEGYARLPQGPRPQGRRRRPDRHARPLARQDHDRRDGGRQARLLREADDAHGRAGDRRARRGPQAPRRSCRSARTPRPTTATGRPHEAIKAGRIGKVTWAQGSYNRNARVCLFNTHQKIDPTAGPDKTGEDHIDWDMWLGHKCGPGPEDPLEPRALLPVPQVLAVQRRRRHRPAVPQAGPAADRHRRPGRRVPHRGSTPAAGSTSRRTAATSPTCS